MTGFGVGGGGRRGHDGLENAKGGGLLSFYWRVLDSVGSNLEGEASVQSGIGLGIWRLSRVGETIQEVVQCNRPPCLGNRIFPKSVEAPLGLLGVSYLCPYTCSI